MRLKTFILLGSCALTLTACGSVKQQLGIERKAPDEFAVVKRAPLALPPDFDLRPPRPGAPRPQEKSTTEQAEETVFGGDVATDTAPGTGEQALLQQAGADNARPNIRQIVDRDAAAMPPAQQTAVKKILNIGKTQPAAASVVDAKAEAERLKKNAAAGKPVTAGETPAKVQ